jgi:hypothetical protein
MVGVGKNGVARRVQRGWLHRVHRAVFAVGRPGLSRKGQWKAATLACGAGAVLSHWSAAEAWSMVERRSGPIHVSVPTAGGRARRDGIRIHRIAALDAATTRLDNIPVTRPQRTLEDLKRFVTPGEPRSAVRQAEVLDLPVDATHLIPDLTASPLELAFLELCRRHRLPEPEVNVPVDLYRVDFSGGLSG